MREGGRKEKGGKRNEKIIHYNVSLIIIVEFLFTSEMEAPGLTRASMYTSST